MALMRSVDRDDSLDNNADRDSFLQQESASVSRSVGVPGLYTVTRPGAEVVLHVHAASDTLGSANRPVLLKGPRAIDGRLVGAGRHGDIVSAAVSLEATLALRSAAGVVCAV